MRIMIIFSSFFFTCHPFLHITYCDHIVPNMSLHLERPSRLHNENTVRETLLYDRTQWEVRPWATVNTTNTRILLHIPTHLLDNVICFFNDVVVIQVIPSDQLI